MRSTRTHRCEDAREVNWAPRLLRRPSRPSLNGRGTKGRGQPGAPVVQAHIIERSSLIALFLLLLIKENVPQRGHNAGVFRQTALVSSRLTLGPLVLRTSLYGLALRASLDGQVLRTSFYSLYFAFIYRPLGEPERPGASHQLLQLIFLLRLRPSLALRASFYSLM